ncbi:hypothetical protein U1Q18_023626 [Sarracenia purpurea var. burkii]
MNKRKGSKSNEEKGEDETMKKIWDCGSPLYDSYELVSVDRVIDRHIMALPSLGEPISSTITEQISQYSSAMVVVITSKEDDGDDDDDDDEEGDTDMAKGSSIASYFGGFLKTKKKKKMKKKSRRGRMVDDGREKKPKKLINGFYRIFDRICSWKK